MILPCVVEEAVNRQKTQSLLRISGIIGGEEFRTMPLLSRSGRRLSWQTMNIALNLIAASVIAVYQDTLAAIITLAVFLPMVSDMSGCSGNQAVAVSMRELSLGLVRPTELLWVLAKEARVGIVNGLFLGLVLGLIAYVWKGNAWLGLVVGQALAAGFKEAAPKFALDIVAEYEYALQDRQFGPLVAKVKADNPEVIYASGYYFTAGPLVSQLRTAGITTPVIGQEGYDSDTFMEIAGDAAEGTLLTTSPDRDSESPVIQAFIADFKKATGIGTDMVAASTYTVAYVLIDGFKKTGGKGGAALVLGVVEAYGTIYFGKLLDRNAIAFAFLILVLMVRPQGLFSRR